MPPILSTPSTRSSTLHPPHFTIFPLSILMRKVPSLRPYSNLEVSDLVSCTKKVTYVEAKIELSLNQGLTFSPNLILLAKLITNKDIGLTYVRDVVIKTWNPVYPLEVKCMDKDIFMFSFNHEVDAHRAYHRQPWFCKGGHLILKTWSL